MSPWTRSAGFGAEWGLGGVGDVRRKDICVKDSYCLLAYSTQCAVNSSLSTHSIGIVYSNIGQILASEACIVAAGHLSRCIAETGNGTEGLSSASIQGSRVSMHDRG